VKVIFKLSEDEVGEVDVKLNGIRAKDETFKYKIVKAYDGSGFLLIVYAEDRDQAYRRGMWLWDKVFNREKLFTVK